MPSDLAPVPTHTEARFLEIHSLSARFVSHLGELDALDNVSLSVQQGEFICLVGPSGCGKSTLLRIVAGLIPPTVGTVALRGSAHHAPGRELGLVFQQPTLLPWRSVERNVALPLELAGVAPDVRGRRVADLLALVGLTDFAHEYPANLSGGMAQRAAIARALAQNPEVLLLDEPFGALDALTREHMAGELLRIWEQTRKTVLMVTHNVEEAALLADRVIVMSPRPGRVIARITVPLPRPRSVALLGTQPLQQIAQQLRAALSRGGSE
ncbi:MAG: ABC transporter ATP-binding protein [Anaerolineae bacterium]|jgi:NitT/TauT family transport system ATP-binding protein|nr:ABC transporter ATP-binding protein [Anaerolineae bacterium]